MTLVTQETHKNDVEFQVIEQVLMQGDLSKLTPPQRVMYYNKVCESLGLNPYTKPFDYIDLKGKLTLYAKKDATEQLRKAQKISITELSGRIVDDIYIVTVKACTPDGRVDQATGAVTIGGLRGEAKANAIMKAETKAKRRATLSIAGLGWTDETEIESIPGAKPVVVDPSTGEIQLEQPKIEEKQKIEEPIVVEPKINSEQLDRLTFISDQLTDDQQEKILGWMTKNFGASELDQIPSSKFSDVLGCMLRAAKANEEQSEAN